MTFDLRPCVEFILASGIRVRSFPTELALLLDQTEELEWGFANLPSSRAVYQLNANSWDEPFTDNHINVMYLLMHEILDVIVFNYAA